MQRRKFLAIAGSTSVIVAAGGLGAGTFVNTRTPHAALESWRTAGAGYPDPMRRALSYAILAPNPHNRQPWVVDLRNDREAVLSCDRQRLLPETDPYSRQIVIGLGCFVELFSIAASHFGERAEITLFPQGEPGERLDTRPVAHLRLAPDPQLDGDALFAHALTRHTNRSAYDTSRAIAPATLQAIAESGQSAVTVGVTADGPLLEPLRTLTRAALRDEILDPRAFQESVDLMRIGRAEIEANPDGIYLGGAFLETLSLLGVLTREALADPASSAFQVGLDMVDEQALSAMGFVWISTAGNSRRDQIAAGRSYLRIALIATGHGLAMQPMSQALQEYPAMQPHFDRVHTLLRDSGGDRIQMLARLGYAREVAPAPRWALSTRIKAS